MPRAVATTRAKRGAPWSINWADLFSTPIFRERGRADYVTWLQSETGQAKPASRYCVLLFPIEHEMATTGEWRTPPRH